VDIFMIRFTSPDGLTHVQLLSLESIETYLASPGNSLTGWVVTNAEGQDDFEPTSDERKYWVHYRGKFEEDIIKLTAAMTKIELSNTDNLYNANWFSLDKLWAKRNMYIGYTLVLVTPDKDKARKSYQKSIRPMPLLLPMQILGIYIYASSVGCSGKVAVEDYLKEIYGKG
jgi:hypothetical protein